MTFGSVYAGNAVAGNAGGVDRYAELEVVDFDEEVGSIAFEDGAVFGHPSLSDGVVVNDGSWSNYTFWVPPSDEYLSVYVSFPREEGDYWDVADYQPRFFGVADRFVQELGWLG